MMEVDNSADGNCLYYAYSISLMYFLRSKDDDRNMSQLIFDKLHISEVEKSSLNHILDESPAKPISKSNLKIIEQILGAATRKAAGDFMVYQFKLNPEQSSLFTTANHAMIVFTVKNLLKNNHREAASLLQPIRPNDCGSAEIYQVTDMKKAMAAYIASNIDEMVAEYDSLWEQFQNDNSNSTAADGPFKKRSFLETVISKYTVMFFEHNNYQFLNEYRNHIQKNYLWGTDETLSILHNGILGQRAVRNEAGQVEFEQDVHINMQMFINGASPFFHSGQPDMIMNNKGNNHWTSMLPPHIYENEKAEQLKHEQNKINLKLTQSLINLQKAIKDIPSKNKEFVIANKLSDQLTNYKAIICDSSCSNDKVIRHTKKMLKDIDTAAPKLAEFRSFTSRLVKFLSILLDFIPSFLGGNCMRSGLERVGFYKKNNRTDITKSIDNIRAQISDLIKDIQPEEDKAAHQTVI